MIVALQKYKCDPKFINAIASEYMGGTTRSNISWENCWEVEVSSGIRQGCTGSPFFMMMLNHVIGTIFKQGKDLEIIMSTFQFYFIQMTDL